LFLSLVLQDYRILVCAQLLVIIVIAGRLSLLGFVFKPVSWLAGDSRLRQTFSLRIHLVERQSLSSICPSTVISYLRSLEASLSTSASRSTAGPIVFSLDRNKPVTHGLVTVQLRDVTRELTIVDIGMILGLAHLIPETDRRWLVNSWIDLCTFNKIY